MTTFAEPIYEKPFLNYETSASGDEVVYYGKQINKPRERLIRVLMGLLWLVAILTFVFIGLPMTGGYGPKDFLGKSIVFVAIFGSIGAAWLLKKNGLQPDKIPIRFNKDGMHFGNKSYAWAHIKNLGWSEPGGFSVMGSAAAVAFAKNEYETGGVVYMTYGSQKISILKNLHPEETERVHSEIHECASKFSF